MIGGFCLDHNFKIRMKTKTNKTENCHAYLHRSMKNKILETMCI